MDKKMTAIIAILLSSIGVVSLAVAQQQTPTICTGEGCVRPVYPDLSIAYGVALSRTTLKTKPAIVMVMNYRSTTTTYLIIDDAFYKMTKVYENYEWETGTKVLQYKAEDGSTMTVLIQYYTEGMISISADFKDYTITFKPINRYLPRLVIETEPVPSGLVQSVEQQTGIDIEDILEKPNSPIADWVG